MKILTILIAASTLVVSCAQPPSDQATPPANASLSTNQVDATQLTLRIHDIVQETVRTLVIGEKSEDCIRKNLLEQLRNVPVACVDTNISVDVNCGDPIYHIGATISGGHLVAVEVGLTPICRE
jgi:hypothetical protein